MSYFLNATNDFHFLKRTMWTQAHLQPGYGPDRPVPETQDFRTSGDPAQPDPMTGNKGHTQKSKTAGIASVLSTLASAVSQAILLANLSTSLKPLLATSSHEPLFCLWDSPGHQTFPVTSHHVPSLETPIW